MTFSQANYGVCYSTKTARNTSTVERVEFVFLNCLFLFSVSKNIPHGKTMWHPSKKVLERIYHRFGIWLGDFGHSPKKSLSLDGTFLESRDDSLIGYLSKSYSEEGRLRGNKAVIGGGGGKLKTKNSH